MSYHHFTIEERCCLREFYKKGYSYRKIAELLGRNVSSVSRELRRNCTHMYDTPSYYPHTAQKKSNLRRSYCHRGMFWSEELIKYIEEKLLATWSPEQIANAPSPFEKMPSARTIYRWIYDKYLLNGNLKVLRRKGKSHLGKETRGKFNLGKSIRKRDKSVYKRKEAGHWEADTVVSGQGKSKACFATLAERKTRLYLAMKIPDRKADTMAAAIITMLSEFPGELVKTITCDRGSEFANWQMIEKKLNCDVYFADKGVLKGNTSACPCVIVGTGIKKLSDMPFIIDRHYSTALFVIRGMERYREGYWKLKLRKLANACDDTAG